MFNEPSETADLSSPLRAHSRAKSLSLCDRAGVIVTPFGPVASPTGTGYRLFPSARIDHNPLPSPFRSDRFEFRSLLASSFALPKIDNSFKFRVIGLVTGLLRLINRESLEFKVCNYSLITRGGSFRDSTISFYAFFDVRSSFRRLFYFVDYRYFDRSIKFRYYIRYYRRFVSIASGTWCFQVTTFSSIKSKLDGNRRWLKFLLMKHLGNFDFIIILHIVVLLKRR